jgi:hypothetical protein
MISWAIITFLKNILHNGVSQSVTIILDGVTTQKTSTQNGVQVDDNKEYYNEVYPCTLSNSF